MKTACIFPIVNNEEKIPDILTSFKKTVGPQLCKLGASGQPELKFPGLDNYYYVPVNQEIEKPEKGESILSCLSNCVSFPEVVIVCDGSGKIPYEYMSNIFKELISDSSICCVMANRKGYKAIDDFRYLIERFEVFCLVHFLNHPVNIPDGQCGLWCYKTGKLNINGISQEIILTATGYEIELDLLSEVLDKKWFILLLMLNYLPKKKFRLLLFIPRILIK
jgi:hypothetical protein